MEADGRQVGGSHYRSGGGEQHWTRQWRLHGRGYFIGQITRYVERYHLKNGLEDLAKAEHYIQKLRELEQAWSDGTGPPPGETGAAPLPGMKYARTEAKPTIKRSPLRPEAIYTESEKAGAGKPFHIWVHTDADPTRPDAKTCKVCGVDYDSAAYNPCEPNARDLITARE
jgi:hypothetical protein